MPQYKYTAKGAGENVIHGTLDAKNEEAVLHQLEKQALFPLSITLADGAIAPTLETSPHKLKKHELSSLTRQIYDMISSGVSLLKALEIVESQSHNKVLKGILETLIQSVRQGQKLSEALKSFPAVFPPFFISLVRSGEESGSLDQVLMRLADHAESQEELRSKIKAALAYPVFVLAVGLFVIAILLTFVIPKMSGIFEDLGQSLPLLTRVLVGISQWISQFWWFLGTLGLALSLGFRRHYAGPEGKRFWQGALLKLPFFGKMHRDTEMARFARTLHMLLANGVPFVRALEIVCEAASDVSFKEQILDLQQGLGKGERLREGLKRAPFLPPNLVNMLIVGEESGQLERSLKRIAESLERSIDRNVKLGTSLLEPLMILIIGSFVGLIALGMLLPIFQINFLVR